MYKLCKTEPSARRQRQLEDGLLNAMLSQRYEDIAISDLCDQLAIPRKSFYRYFASKDGALHALIDHRLLEYEMLNMESRGHHDVSLDIPRFFSFWLSQKPLLDALHRSGLSTVLVERAMLVASQNQALELGVRGLPKDLREMGTTFVVTGLLAAVMKWHRDGFRQTPQEMAEITQQLLSRPLLPEFQP